MGGEKGARSQVSMGWDGGKGVMGSMGSWEEMLESVTKRGRWDRVQGEWRDARSPWCAMSLFYRSSELCNSPV